MQISLISFFLNIYELGSTIPYFDKFDAFLHFPKIILDLSLKFLTAGKLEIG